MFLVSLQCLINNLYFYACSPVSLQQLLTVESSLFLDDAGQELRLCLQTATALSLFRRVIVGRPPQGTGFPHIESGNSKSLGTSDAQIRLAPINMQHEQTTMAKDTVSFGSESGATSGHDDIPFSQPTAPQLRRQNILTHARLDTNLLGDLTAAANEPYQDEHDDEMSIVSLSNIALRYTAHELIAPGRTHLRDQLSQNTT